MLNYFFGGCVDYVFEMNCMYIGIMILFFKEIFVFKFNVNWCIDLLILFCNKIVIFWFEENLRVYKCFMISLMWFLRYLDIYLLYIKILFEYELMY